MPLKRKKAQQGFTLVELLAVIVILAIVLAIAVPMITGIIKKATINAFEQDAKMLIKAIDYQALQESGLDINAISASNIESKLGISNNNYSFLSIVLDENNKHYIYIEGKNKWDDLVACGTFSNIIVESKDNISVCDLASIEEGSNTSAFDGNVNRPLLAQGMIPIKWVNNGGEKLEVETTTEDDPEWYDYGTNNETRRWANAVSYENGDPFGEPVAYWVWIPRYAYQIETGYHNKNVGKINIKFLKETTKKTVDNEEVEIYPVYNETETEQTNYVVHPAFKFDEEELTGFWVAKFEISPDDTSSNQCYASSTLINCNGSDVLDIVPKILPGKMSWRNIQVGNIFNVSRYMETKSIYGWNTTSGDISTLGSFTSGEPNGIYDMSGGAYEFISAYLESGNPTYLENGSSIYSANDKYKNVYKGYYSPLDDAAGSYKIWGDAIWETSSKGDKSSSTSWYEVSSNFVLTGSPWFHRGGGNGSGGIFYFIYDAGAGNDWYSWRVAVLVGNEF